MFEFFKRFVLRSWSLIAAVSVLLAFLVLRSEVRVTPNAVKNPYAAEFVVTNEGVFPIRRVELRCGVHFWIPNEKNIYDPGLGWKAAIGSGEDAAEQIDPASSHTFVCNFSNAAANIAAQPAQASPYDFTAELRVSYRPLFWFRRNKKVMFAATTRDGHTDWRPF